MADQFTVISLKTAWSLHAGSDLFQGFIDSICKYNMILTRQMSQQGHHIYHKFITYLSIYRGKITFSCCLTGKKYVFIQLTYCSSSDLPVFPSAPTNKSIPTRERLWKGCPVWYTAQFCLFLQEAVQQA